MWLFVTFLGIITFLLWLLSSPFYWWKRNIPYLIPYPLFGNFFPIFTNGIIDFNKSLYQKFPNERFFGLHMFTRPIMYLKDPELIQRLLVTDFEYFTSHGMYSNQDRDPAGGNVFHIYGQQWKEIRSKLSQHFTPAKVKSMLNNVDKTLSKAMVVIDNNIAKSEPTEMKFILMNITTDVLTQAILGIETDTFVNKDSIFSEIAEMMFKPKLTSKLFISIITPKLYDLFKMCIFDEQATEKFIAIVRKTIEYRRKENVRRQDFLQGMMDLMENNNANQEQKFFPDNTRVPRYDLDTLISQATLLFAAGVESSALTMTLFLYEMAVHPDLQKKCRTEIESIAKENGDKISVSDLPKLIYLGAALQETLRLHSPLSMINRECTKEYKIPGSNIIIEKGTFILMSTTGSYLDPTYYPEPEAFRPERFLYGNKITSGIFFPFGIGPRACLGMGLANGEMKLVTAKLLQRYEFCVSSKIDIPMKYGKYNFLKTPANGMWLNIKPIKK